MKIREKVMNIVFLMSALFSVGAIALICLFLFINGIPAMAEIGIFKFLLGTEWRPSNNIYGIFPMVVGSLYVTAGAIAVGVPLGILTAVFLVEFCPKGMLRLISPIVSLMAGIPSVIYGFFGLTVVVPLVRNSFGGTGSSILTASVLLGIMILPTIITMTQSALKAVPRSYYESSLALGETHEKTIFRTMIPAAHSGIFAGIVLGIGRAIGETMAVIMVAGNQARITGNLLKGIRTLTANIVIEMGYAADLHRGALVATGVVLFVFVLLINLVFSIIKRRSSQ